MKRHYIAGTLLIIFLSASSALNASSDMVKIVAHRGAWKMESLPQNSIAALKQALDMKLEGTEFDVHMTADDSLVLNHDKEYNKLHIEKTKYADLARFRFPNGEKIPTLHEYLKAGSQNNENTLLVCELKPSAISREKGIKIAEAAVGIVRKLKLEKRVAYICFDYEMIKWISENEPSAETQYLNGDKSPSELKKAGIKGADYNISVFKRNPHWIDEAKEKGITLNAWTVNKPDDMDWLIIRGFDFITTDEPELLTDRIAANPLNKGWKLAWNDEFDFEGIPDSTKWNYDVGGHGWGNNEKQYYLAASQENSYIKDGKLRITALKKDYGKNNYTSAKLTTYKRYSFMHGKVEVSAKLPSGKGTWPAIWMLPESIKDKTEQWPLCGEIDIMEHVGKDQDVIHTSLHTHLYNHIKGTQITHSEKLTDVSGSFHKYGIEWDEKSIRFLIDEKLFFQASRGENGRDKSNEGWPFNKNYFLILNLAVGGNWGGAVDDSVLPAVMEVDYVRIFRK